METGKVRVRGEEIEFPTDWATIQGMAEMVGQCDLIQDYIPEDYERGILQNAQERLWDYFLATTLRNGWNDDTSGLTGEALLKYVRLGTLTEALYDTEFYFMHVTDVREIGEKVLPNGMKQKTYQLEWKWGVGFPDDLQLEAEDEDVVQADGPESSQDCGGAG